MTKDTLKRLTITDILKDKEKYQVKKDVTEEVFVERLGITILVEKPGRSLCLDAIDMTKDANTENEADEFLVYNTVIEPNLKDAELQRAFDCKVPTDIVKSLFEPGETAQISQIAMGLAGYSNNVKLVKDLKN